MRIASLHIGHNSSSSFYDGENLFYFLEERYSRVKYDSRYLYCCEKIFDQYFEELIISSFSPSISKLLLLDGQFQQFLQNYKNRYGKNLKITIDTEHHRNHASLAFYNSGFDRSLIIVADGSGKIYDFYRELESVYIAEYPNKFFPIYKNFGYLKKDIIEEDIAKNFPNCEIHCKSLMGIGFLYGSAANHIGQNQLEAGKIMGLSSYGNPTNTNYIKNDYFVDDSMFRYDIRNHEYFCKNIPITKQITKSNFQIFADYSADLQIQTQEVMCKIIDKFVSKTGIKKVCITGGYAMNVIANSYYLEKFPEVEFFIEPLSTDVGCSLGAALFHYRDKTKDTKIKTLNTAFFHGSLTNSN